MKLSVIRDLPDGSTRIVVPFHICIKGMEEAVICRDDADYDMMVKTIFLSAKARNVIVIIYAAMSNHCHAGVLAFCREDAAACGEEIKRRYSMWLSHRYGERKVMKGVKVSALPMIDRWHVRNALAYIPRNALDNGYNVDEYRWSGSRAMFSLKSTEGLRPVRKLSRRDARAIFHSADRLDGVPWKLDADNCLEPLSCCDHLYLEQAFEHDQTFFLKTIGSMNMIETRFSLEEQPFNMQRDSDFLKKAEDLAQQWYGKQISELPLDKRYRLLPYLYRTNRTTVSQLSRVLSLNREMIKVVLKIV